MAERGRRRSINAGRVCTRTLWKKKKKRFHKKKSTSVGFLEYQRFFSFVSSRGLIPSLITRCFISLPFSRRSVQWFHTKSCSPFTENHIKRNRWDAITVIGLSITSSANCADDLLIIRHFFFSPTPAFHFLRGLLYRLLGFLISPWKETLFVLEIGNGPSRGLFWFDFIYRGIMKQIVYGESRSQVSYCCLKVREE